MMYCFSNGAFLSNIFILQLPGDEDLQFLQIGLLALFIRMLLGNCVDQCHTGSAKPAIGKSIQSHYNKTKYYVD